MNSSRARRNLGLFLAAAAMTLGLGLTGWSELSPVTYASVEESHPEMAVAVPEGVVTGLPSFADLSEAVSPAVVSIQSTTIQEGPARRGMNPFEFFLRPQQRPQQDDEPQERRSDASGSGFIISSDGLVVTNHHVIENATEIHVTIGDQRYTAVVKGDDPATDIAVLKIEADEPLPFLELAGDSLRVGDWVMVIGSPLRLVNSVSVGVVSAQGRTINVTPEVSLENFIQTDAAINFGNSGGPLVDLRGQVVGIATAINFGAENIGFAVPVSTLRQILPQLIKSGSVRRGYLGVFIEELRPETAEAFGYDSLDGALVNQVGEDSPSYGVLQPGDIIFEADGRKIADNRDLIQYVSSMMPGTEIDLRIFRDGKAMPIQISLGERPGTGGEVAVDDQEEQEGSIEWLGIDYRDLNEQIRNSHGIASDVEGVWIREVAPTSPLFDRGVRPGDVIREVNREAVGGVRDFEAAVRSAESGSQVLFYVSRFDPRAGQAASFFATARVP